MDKANNQARKMTAWLLMVVAVVVLVIAIGFMMFNMPGRGSPEEHRSGPTTSE